MENTYPRLDNPGDLQLYIHDESSTDSNEIAVQHDATYDNPCNQASQTERCYLGPSGSAASQGLQFGQSSLSTNLGSGILSTPHRGVEQPAIRSVNVVDPRVTRLVDDHQRGLVSGTGYRPDPFEPFSFFRHQVTTPSSLGSDVGCSNHTRILDGLATGLGNQHAYQPTARSSDIDYRLGGRTASEVNPDELQKLAHANISASGGGNAGGSTACYGYSSASHGTEPSSSGARQTSLHMNAGNGIVAGDAIQSRGVPEEVQSRLFYMYKFKVEQCPDEFPHNWRSCPFWHPADSSRRRDPSKFQYSGTLCQHFKRGKCRKGDTCLSAHGLYEADFHPTQYKTKACGYGQLCAQLHCPFVHGPGEHWSMMPNHP